MSKKVRVAYQGVPGAYSHSAAGEVFPNSELVGHATFEEAVQAVHDGNADYAMLPIENSTAGRVASMHTLLPESGLHIVREYFFHVKHQLIGKESSELENIKRVYSHPQALAQCGDFIKQYKLEEIPFGDTAAAVKYISKPGGVGSAAIASREAAILTGGVKILAEDINTKTDNVTRFVVLYTEPKEHENVENKKLITSIFYKTKNIPAALYKSLAGLATAGINMIKLESFIPMLGNGGASFYLEFEGGADTEDAKQALLELSHYASEVKILGTYEEDEFRLG